MLIAFLIVPVISIQVTQQVYVVEDWVRSATNSQNAETQAEDQRKELYTTQLNLAIEQTAILDLKTKLQKAEEALKVAQEAVKAAETIAYERGVLETEAMLTAEVTVVCREYCAETYNQALDRAGIPADSNLRRVDQVYYPEDFKENTTAPPPSVALPLPPSEQSLTTQEPSQGAEVPAGAKKEKNGALVASRTEEKAKEKEKGKEMAKNKTNANPS